MKPAWDQLAGEYDGHASVVVGDVDCTVSFRIQQLNCQRHMKLKRACRVSAEGAGSLRSGGRPGLPDHQVLEGRRRVQVPGERPSSFALTRSRLRFLSFS